MQKKYNIAIADDHVLLRKALSRLINAFENYKVLFEAESGNELKDMIAKQAIPDLVLMDVNMPNGNGHEATAWGWTFPNRRSRRRTSITASSPANIARRLSPS